MYVLEKRGPLKISFHDQFTMQPYSSCLQIILNYIKGFSTSNNVVTLSWLPEIIKEFLWRKGITDKDKD